MGEAAEGIERGQSGWRRGKGGKGMGLRQLWRGPQSGGGRELEGAVVS